MNRTPEQEISSESKNATTDCDIPICKKNREETKGCLLFTSSESTRVARPKLPLLTLHPPPISEDPYPHQSDDSVFVSYEVIHELDEEHGSSTHSSNRDGRLTPSFLDPPFSPCSSIGNRSSFSYFSYLGNNFTRSSTGSPVIIVGNGIILSAVSSSSFMCRLPSNNVNYPEVFESDETARLNKVIDYCSCMCCVKALFYHCSKDCDEEEFFNEDNLCACDKPGSACMKRWGIISLLACCMPLLIFYPPLKAIQNATRKLRKRFRRKGLGS